MSNTREHPRSALRTLVTILQENPPHIDRPLPIKAWMEDISASGIQFASDEEISSDRVWVRILLPELQDKLVECHIVRRGEREGDNLPGGAPGLLYGARFERIRSLDEFEPGMLSSRESHVPA
jgi:hypothetical protein